MTSSRDLVRRMLAVRTPQQARRLMPEVTEWLADNPNDVRVRTAAEYVTKLAA